MAEQPGIIAIGDGLHEAEKWIVLFSVSRALGSMEMAIHLTGIMLLGTLGQIGKIEHAYRCPADHGPSPGKE